MSLLGKKKNPIEVRVRDMVNNQVSIMLLLGVIDYFLIYCESLETMKVAQIQKCELFHSMQLYANSTSLNTF